MDKTRRRFLVSHTVFHDLHLRELRRVCAALNTDVKCLFQSSFNNPDSELLKYLRKILTKKSSKKKPGKRGAKRPFVDEGVFWKIFSLIFCVNILVIRCFTNSLSGLGYEHLRTQRARQDKIGSIKDLRRSRRGGGRGICTGRRCSLRGGLCSLCQPFHFLF